MVTELPVEDDGIILLRVSEVDPDIDATYDPTSPRAQSGLAVAQALYDYIAVEGTALRIGGQHG